MVTNGYLLPDNVVSKLIECKIDTLQVTIDGLKETHDKRRVLVNGDGSYDKIIGNIKKFSNLLKFMIRVNIDKSNLNAIDETINTFKTSKELKKIYIYPGKVIFESASIFEKEKCLKMDEFSIEFFKHQLVFSKETISLPSNTPCAASKVINFVVDADGSLYKCWNEVGIKEYSFGNILKGVKHTGISLDYALDYFYNNSKCENCKYLPICGDSCVSKKKICEGKLECCIEKYTLEKRLNIIIEQMKTD